MRRGPNADGTIVVGGVAGRFGCPVMRLMSTGTPDPTWNGDGSASTRAPRRPRSRPDARSPSTAVVPCCSHVGHASAAHPRERTDRHELRRRGRRLDRLLRLRHVHGRRRRRRRRGHRGGGLGRRAAARRRHGAREALPHRRARRVVRRPRRVRDRRLARRCGRAARRPRRRRGGRRAELPARAGAVTVHAGERPAMLRLGLLSLDTVAPLSTIDRPEAGATYGQLGLLALRGTAADLHSDVVRVDVALRKTHERRDVHLARPRRRLGHPPATPRSGARPTARCSGRSACTTGCRRAPARRS